jgi:hypothetical protein
MVDSVMMIPRPPLARLLMPLAAAVLALGGSPASALAGARSGSAGMAIAGTLLGGQLSLPGVQVRRAPMSEQERAFRATVEGRAVPLPIIERRIVPLMGGADYLGPEIRGSRYRLKFVQDGRLVWIDVDAASGRVLRASPR